MILKSTTALIPMAPRSANGPRGFFVTPASNLGRLPSDR
jgi:hypothetical protein